MVAEGLYGASLGKLILKLRVVSEARQPITILQAFKRNLAYYYDALFFGAVGFSKMRETDLQQRNGDHWARTLVLKLPDVPAESRQGVEIFVLSFLISSVTCVTFYATGLIVRAF